MRLMNIFYVDRDPAAAAQALCDKHVTKMTLESCQMLAAVYHLPCAEHPPPPKADGKPYRRGYWNHPSQVWARSSLANWRWLHAHAEALAAEHVHRFGSVHGCYPAILYMAHLTPTWLPSGPLTEPPQCVSAEHRGADTVAAYRAFYDAAKRRFATWTNRTPPPWWPDRETAA